VAVLRLNAAPFPAELALALVEVCAPAANVVEPFDDGTEQDCPYPHANTEPEIARTAKAKRVFFINFPSMLQQIEGNPEVGDATAIGFFH
jgi:hypothetical protein